MRKKMVRRGMTLGLWAASLLTAVLLAPDVPGFVRQHDFEGFFFGTLALWLLFALYSCWNAYGAALLLALVASVKGLPAYARFAAAFIGSLLASCALYFAVQRVRPSQTPGVGRDAIALLVGCAAFLSVGFAYLERREAGAWNVSANQR